MTSTPPRRLYLNSARPGTSTSPVRPSGCSWTRRATPSASAWSERRVSRGDDLADRQYLRSGRQGEPGADRGGRPAGRGLPVQDVLLVPAGGRRGSPGDISGG